MDTPLRPIERYRRERQLSQAELAAILGVTKATISRWEAGKRSPRRQDITHIAKKTGLTAAEILGLEGVA